MRLAISCLLAMALLACTQAETPAPIAGEPGLLLGEFRAASDTARQLTGDVAIERGGLVFTKGVVLYTRGLEGRRGYDLVARDGDTYAALAVGAGEMIVDLRRVVEQTLAPGARGLCGDEAPRYLALGYEARAASVTMMVFAGEEAPGPNATQSRLCGAFAYVAPDGARTRQGVLLQ